MDAFIGPGLPLRAALRGLVCRGYRIRAYYKLFLSWLIWSLSCAARS